MERTYRSWAEQPFSSQQKEYTRPTPLLCPHGKLLAKGWAAGLQFDVLFTDDLYGRLGAHAVDMAEKLKAGLREKGYTLYIDSPTNQQFIVADDALLARFSGQVAYGFWEKLPEGRTVIRFATSWGTQPEEIDALLAFL